MKINSKTWLWLISILLIANLAITAYGYFKKSPKTFEKRPFLSEQLKFDEKQIAELKLLTDQHQYKIRLISDSLRIYKDLFFEGLRNGKNLNEQDEYARNIGKLEAEKDKVTYLHFESIRSICNESQKSDFDKLLREILHPKPMRGGPGEKGDRKGPPMNGERPPPPMNGNGPPPPMGEEGPPPPRE